MLPMLFWGTFDLITILFSGEERPFFGEEYIEKVAFNEQFVEFGFWPGDEQTEEPTLFVLAYPFLETALGTERIIPKEAVFSREKQEYLLKLKDLVRHENPVEVLEQFCHSTFSVITEEEKWENLDWLARTFSLDNP